MKYTFMAAHETQFQIKRMCRVLGVQRSGYYDWRGRKPSTRAQANEALLKLIKEEHQNSRKTYGSPRLHVVLRRRGEVCGRNRVARLMRLHGIVAPTRRRYHPVTTQRQPGVVPAPNRLNQDFSASAPTHPSLVRQAGPDVVERLGAVCLQARHSELVPLQQQLGARAVVCHGWSHPGV